MRYIWLVYLGALFFQPAFDPTAGPVDWFAAVALIAVFLPLYVAGHRAADDRQLLSIVAGMAALAVAGSLINGGASVFVIYAAAIAAYLEPVRRAVRGHRCAGRRPRAHPGHVDGPPPVAVPGPDYQRSSSRS